MSVNSPFSGMSCRSREGAWIEIGYDEGDIDRPPGRSREGAWIEIDGYVIDNQIRVSRSREGAWIEMHRDMS